MPDESDWIREDDEWFRPDQDDADEAPTTDDEHDGDDEGPRRGSAMAWVLALVLVLLVGLGSVAGYALLSGDDDDGESASELDTGSSTTSTTKRELGVPGQLGSSTTTAASSTSSTVGIGGGGAGTATTKKSATTTTAKQATTTTEPDGDPGCAERGTGAATADNKAAQITFCVDDPTPRVGQQIKVYGSAVDPDAEIQVSCIGVAWDGSPPVASGCHPRTGAPSTVPTNINESFSFSHTFSAPGTYRIRVGVLSDPGSATSSAAETSYTVTVRA